MGTMLEALKKAGLVSREDATKAEKEQTGKYKLTLKQQRHEEWKKRAYKNRMGDIALFEIWRKSTPPDGHEAICALCGKRDAEMSVWCSPYKKRYNICDECAQNEKDQAD